MLYLQIKNDIPKSFKWKKPVSLEFLCFISVYWYADMRKEIEWHSQAA